MVLSKLIPVATFFRSFFLFVDKNIFEREISGSDIILVTKVLELTCNILFLQIIIRVLAFPVRITEYARQKVRRRTPVSACRAPLMSQSRCATITITPIKASASINTRSA